MTAGDVRNLVSLLQAVGRLALSAPEQLSYLQSIGVGDLADELALEFGDRIGLLAGFEEQGWLRPSEVGALWKLHQLLREMSNRSPDREALWGASGLTSDPRWDEVRRCAQDFLFL